MKGGIAIIAADTHASSLDPLTRGCSPLLLKVGGVYLLDLILYRLSQANIKVVLIVTHRYASQLQRYLDQECPWGSVGHVHSRLFTTGFSEIIVIHSPSYQLSSALGCVVRSDVYDFNENQDLIILIDGVTVSNVDFFAVQNFHLALSKVYASRNKECLMTALLAKRSADSSLRPLIAPCITVRDTETGELRDLKVDTTQHSMLLNLARLCEDTCHLQVSMDLYPTGIFVLSPSFLTNVMKAEDLCDFGGIHSFIASFLQRMTSDPWAIGTYILSPTTTAIMVDSCRTYKALSKAYLKGYLRPLSPEANLVPIKGVPSRIQNITERLQIMFLGDQLGTLFQDERSRVSRYASIRGECLVSCDCSVEGHTLLDSTVLCDGASVGSNCVLRDCILDSGAQVGKSCSMTSCYIGSGSIIDPGLSLPTGSIVGPNVHVTRDLINQAIRMIFHLCFRSDLDAYLSFLIRYFLYHGGNIESQLDELDIHMPFEKLSCTVWPRTGRNGLTTRGGDRPKTLVDIITAEHRASFCILMEQLEPLHRFLSLELEDLDSDLILKFLPPIYLTRDDVSAELKSEFEENCKCSRRLDCDQAHRRLTLGDQDVNTPILLSASPREMTFTSLKSHALLKKLIGHERPEEPLEWALLPSSPGLFIKTELRYKNFLIDLVNSARKLDTATSTDETFGSPCFDMRESTCNTFLLQQPQDSKTCHSEFSQEKRLTIDTGGSYYQTLSSDHYSQSSNSDYSTDHIQCEIYTLPSQIAPEIKDSFTKFPDSASMSLATIIKYLLYNGFAYNRSFHAIFDYQMTPSIHLPGSDLAVAFQLHKPYLQHSSSVSHPDANAMGAGIDIINDAQQFLMIQQQALRTKTASTLQQDPFFGKLDEILLKSFTDPIFVNHYDLCICAPEYVTGDSITDSRIVQADPQKLQELRRRCKQDVRNNYKTSSDELIKTTASFAIPYLFKALLLYVFFGPDQFSGRLTRDTILFPSQLILANGVVLERKGDQEQEDVDSQRPESQAKSVQLSDFMHIGTFFAKVMSFLFKEDFDDSILRIKDEEESGQEIFLYLFCAFCGDLFQEHLARPDVSSFIFACFTMFIDSDFVSFEGVIELALSMESSPDENDILIYRYILQRIRELDEKSNDDTYL
ncbi:Translation initiation factor [Giardia muris]|uniref:Translation initiation factor n=1 Tax=Giardia muris TaxID=5742 RepID=A0A4Z1SKW6_GIAMU|nr:Translation initiation factor [Giardia muris]|eukprot:TNJ26272.1 Translation initiation factor [Giardia muris]